MPSPDGKEDFYTSTKSSFKAKIKRELLDIYLLPLKQNKLLGVFLYLGRKLAKILLKNVLQTILHQVLLKAKVRIFRYCSINSFSKDYFRQQYQQFFDPEARFTSNSLADWFEMKIKKYRHEIKILLGVSINPDQDSPIGAAQRILKKLDLKLEKLYFRGSRQTKQRVYGGCQLDADGRAAIFANWLERDEKIYQSQSVLTLL